VANVELALKKTASASRTHRIDLQANYSMKAPCEELSIHSKRQSTPCAAHAGPWILAATILGSSMAFIDSTVVNVAAPKLQSAFHASVVDVQWVIESYGVFLSALILAGGAMGDRLGRRLVFLLGVGIFAAASAACGMAPSIHLLVLARSVQGVGAALLIPGSLAIISASFDEKTRGRAIGTWSAFTAITMALGPVLGGWLIEHASWRWAFFINLPLAAAVALISLRHVPESRSASAGRLDWLGAGLATASLGCGVTGLLESSILGWRNPLVIGGLLGGANIPGSFRVGGDAGGFADGIASAIQVSIFSGRESLDALAVCGDRRFLSAVPDDLDARVWILGHIRRGGQPASHPVAVSDVAVDGRTGGALRRETAAYFGAADGRNRFLTLCCAFEREQLLEDVFSRLHRARSGHGCVGGSVDYRGDEFG
jgi:MFS family permease